MWGIWPIDTANHARIVASRVPLPPIQIGRPTGFTVLFSGLLWIQIFFAFYQPDCFLLVPAFHFNPHSIIQVYVQLSMFALFCYYFSFWFSSKFLVSFFFIVNKPRDRFPLFVLLFTSIYFSFFLLPHWNTILFHAEPETLFSGSIILFFPFPCTFTCYFMFLLYI